MKITIKIIALLIILGSTACNDFLDQAPDNRAEITDVESVGQLLVSAYPNISHILFAELMSDNADDLGPQYSTFYQWYDDVYAWEPVIEDGQDSPASYWSACYTAIAAANHALEAIVELGDTEEFLPYRGEALVCRAYSHFMLVNVFAQHYNPETADSEVGIPYVTLPETEVLADYERLSVGEVYRLIEADLVEGLELISNSAYDIPSFHFTIQAANAFASRFYLYKAEWEKVIEHADNALGDSPEQFLRDWEAYDVMSYYELTEQYTRSTEPCNLMMIGTLSWWARAYASNRYGTHIELVNDFYSYYAGYHPWGGGQTVSGSTYSVNSGTYAMKNVYSSGVDVYYTPKWDEKFEYSYAGASTGLGWLMQPAFTGEEVLLNRAEAYIMNNQITEGTADLNFWVETHCPYPGSFPESLEDYYTNVEHPALNPAFTIDADKELLIYAVLDVRRRELLHEGFRWFDIKRYNFEITHEYYDGSSITLAPNDYRRAIQIPQDALNNGIEGNTRTPEATSEYVKLDGTTFPTDNY